MAARLKPGEGHHVGRRRTFPRKPAAKLPVVYADVGAEFADPQLAVLGASNAGEDVDGPLV
ncbi:hypothetical protein [Methylobacterium sp. MA0201]|uniref:hypothetical protein n=1 Tax=Methylobacterium alsaeris TaxID=3344826 RepID=UPI003757B1C9